MLPDLQVLEGVFTYKLNGTVGQMQAGESVSIPPVCPHALAIKASTVLSPPAGASHQRHTVRCKARYTGSISSRMQLMLAVRCPAQGVSHQFWNNETDTDMMIRITLEPALSSEAFFENIMGLQKDGYGR